MTLTSSKFIFIIYTSFKVFQSLSNISTNSSLLEVLQEFRRSLKDVYLLSNLLEYFLSRRISLSLWIGCNSKAKELVD